MKTNRPKEFKRPELNSKGLLPDGYYARFNDDISELRHRSDSLTIVENGVLSTYNVTFAEWISGKDHFYHNSLWYLVYLGPL